MENQTTAPVEQSEQPKDVAQPEATPEVKETVLAEATTEQQQEEPKVINFKELIPEEYKEEKALQNFSTMNDFVKSYLNAQRLELKFNKNERNVNKSLTISFTKNSIRPFLWILVVE